MIAADQEDGVIRSGASDHRRQQHHHLVRNGHPGQHRHCRDHRLRGQQGGADGDERQEHGDRVAIDQGQDDQQQDDDRQLDRHAVARTGVGQVGRGGRRAREFGPQGRRGDGAFHDARDVGVGAIGLRRAQLAGQAHRQDPRLAVLGGQQFPKRRGAEEILHHHDLSGLARARGFLGELAQPVHQSAVHHRVVGPEDPVPGSAGQQDQQHVLRAGFPERPADRLRGDDGRRVGGQDRHRVALGHLNQRRHAQRQGQRQRGPAPDHDPGPPRHEIAQTLENGFTARCDHPPVG